MLKIIICACLATGFVIVSATESEAAAATVTASPTPEPTATARPASAGWVKWAKKWQAQARRARTRLARVRRCQGKKPPARLAPAPARCEPNTAWSAAGKAWKHHAKRCRAAAAAGIAKMRRPGGSGVARWMPLARWVGWPAGSLPKLRNVMWRESRGNPRAVNPSSRCAGLLQIHPCHHVANVCDPLVNLRAGLRLYRAAGWQPWGM
jgi:hypothetical protein